MSEILVSDNGTTHQLDAGVLAPAKGRFQSVRLVKPPKAFATAEEHIRWVSSQAYGEYTWICGDNDVPLASSLALLATLLNDSANPRALLFGCEIQLANGVSVPTRGVFGEMDFHGRNGLAVVQRAGFTHHGAGISNWVVPTSAWRVPVFDHLVSAGLPIYSHVTTLIWSLAAVQTSYIAQPLTRYTIEEYVLGSSAPWFKYASEQGKFPRQIWTLDLLAQLQLLVGEHLASWRDFGAVMDGGDGIATRVPLAVMVIDHLIRGVEEISNQKPRASRRSTNPGPTRAQWLHCLDTLWRMDNRLAPVLAQMEPPVVLRSSTAIQWSSNMRSALSDLTKRSTSQYWAIPYGGLRLVSDGVGTWMFPNVMREEAIASVMQRVNREPSGVDNWIEFKADEFSTLDQGLLQLLQSTLDLTSTESLCGGTPQGYDGSGLSADLERLRNILGLARNVFQRLPAPIRSRLLSMSR